MLLWVFYYNSQLYSFSSRSVRTFINQLHENYNQATDGEENEVVDDSFRANWLFEVIAVLCSHYSWTRHYVKHLIYAEAYDFYEIAQREKEAEYKNKLRNSLIIRHAIENMMAEKPVALDTYFDQYGVGFDSGIKDERTPEQIMAEIDAAFENLD